ncbi:MAG: hypothetical protein K2P93_02185 [Alphaproteobacteria bacterium]|nr:hypothetical protein [Alphaproteobacteria bacterium]
MYFNNFCRYTFALFLLLNPHQAFAMLSKSKSEDAGSKAPAPLNPVATNDEESPRRNLVAQSKWNALSGTYIVNNNRLIFSGSDKGCGQADLNFTEDSIIISNFAHPDLSRLTVFNSTPPSDEDLIKMYGESHYTYSCEYGERQIARFIECQLPGTTLTLNSINSFDSKEPQFGVRVQNKEGTEGQPHMDARLVISKDGVLALSIEYPYGFSGFSPIERLLLFKHPTVSSSSSSSSPQGRALDKGEEIQPVAKKAPVLPIFNSSFRTIPSQTRPQNYEFVEDPVQQINKGWGPVSITSRGEGHIVVEGDGYVFYQKIPAQDMLSLDGANLRFEADVFSNTPGAYIQYWGYQSPQSPKLMSTHHTGDGTWQKLSLEFTVNGSDKMFFLYPAILSGLKGLSTVPVVEVKNVTLERL